MKSNSFNIILITRNFLFIMKCGVCKEKGKVEDELERRPFDPFLFGNCLIELLARTLQSRKKLELKHSEYPFDIKRVFESKEKFSFIEKSAFFIQHSVILILGFLFSQ